MNIVKLREQLASKGVSASDLAERSGVDKAVISRLLNGISKSCTVDTAQKISSALKLTPKQSASIFFENSVADTQ